MIRQFYKNKFFAPITWLTILILLFRFILLLGDHVNPDGKSSIELYQAICTPDGMVFFFFPAFSFYCIFGVSFFQRPEIIYRFTLVKVKWRKMKEVFFLDSLFFILLFQGMTFLTYFVLGQMTDYFLILPSLIPVLFMQCATAYVFELLFAVLSEVGHNTALGFLMSYSLVVAERIFLQASGGVPFYFLGGMNFQPAYFTEGKWQVVVCSILATGIFLSFPVPWLLRRRDYLPARREED